MSAAIVQSLTKSTHRGARRLIAMLVCFSVAAVVQGAAAPPSGPGRSAQHDPVAEPLPPPPASMHCEPTAESPKRLFTAAAPSSVLAPRGEVFGDDCLTAIPIGALPFEASGDTCSAADDHDANCPGPSPGSSDLVYSYTPLQNDVLDISLCNPCTNFDTKLYVYTSCPASLPIACNDDSCTTLAFNDFAGASRIEGLSVSAGQTYYIVVDGYGGDCGVYHLTVTGQSSGACCLADGTCVDSLLPQQCSGLGQFHHPAQTCEEVIACPRNSVADACGAGGVFGPAIDLAGAGAGSAYTSDQITGSGYTVYEGFWSVTQSIQQVTWWSIFLNYNGSQFTGPCTPSAIKTQFQISFHADAGGAPGGLLLAPMMVSATVVDTGVPFALGATVRRCTANLPIPLLLPQGWISIVGKNAPAMPGCVHLWVSNPAAGAGDGFAYQAPMAGTAARIGNDLSLCLSGPSCSNYPADVNGDGRSDGGDIQQVVNCVLSGQFVTIGCTCSDLNQDRQLDANDASAMAQQLLETPFGVAEPPTFAVTILSGALPDSTSGSDPTGAAQAYAGIPVSMVLTSDAAPSQLVGLSLEVRDQDAAVLYSAPLNFTGGVSQVLMLPGGAFDTIENVFVEGPNMPDNLELYRFRVRAGRAATAEGFAFSDYLEAVGEPYNTPPASIPFVGQPGACGSAQALNITSPMNDPDDPFSGSDGTWDYFVARLKDAQGRPCAGQVIRITLGNTGAIGLHAPEESDLASRNLLELQTDEFGFIHALVRYRTSGGVSGLSLQSTLSGAPIITAPAPGGGAIQYESVPTLDAVVSNIKGEVAVEDGAKVNEGLKTGGGILVYDRTYCFESKTKRKLKPKEKIVWCVNDQPLLDANSNRIEGPIAYITVSDPNASVANRGKLKVTSKIVVVNGNGMETVKPEKTVEFTITEKKMLSLCVKQYKKTGFPTADAWKAEVKRLNEVYEGTGVCFKLDESDIVNMVSEQKTVRAWGETSGGKTKTQIGGSLVKCINMDASLEGKKDKIVMHVGVNIQTLSDGQWQTGIHGIAVGANEDIEASGQMAGYDICGKFANTIAVKCDKVNAKRATIAHEIGHILGCSHHNHDTGNLMCDGKTRKEEASKITPAQAETIYKNACKIMMSQC